MNLHGRVQFRLVADLEEPVSAAPTDRFGRPQYVCRVCGADNRAMFGPHSRTTCLACRRACKREGYRIKAGQYSLPPLNLPQCRECGLKLAAVRLGLCSYCRREKNGERLHASTRVAS